MSSTPQDSDGAQAPTVVVTVTVDGPYLLSGSTEIRNAEGEVVKTVTKTALCRCGHSENKPFCDGSHRRVGFTDPGPVAPQA
ncbi:CDGSH iron-sulfur domain-containing protein [Kineosporia sp. R_H_3]|uniref:CDGSH iron-sulfur domain-containing protein n=1 Tax=Kineosporia sp. R_H_3 TaxID=1961848 RepID=UPI0018E9E1F3|nr:CDGSH iron-sulfur domain-containing protein [Kineosporia sp. R_H_3]